MENLYSKAPLHPAPLRLVGVGMSNSGMKRWNTFIQPVAAANINARQRKGQAIYNAILAWKPELKHELDTRVPDLFYLADNDMRGFTHMIGIVIEIVDNAHDE